MVRRGTFHSVDQAQAVARRRIPRSVYRYIEGGTEEERTVRANRDAFGEILFRPRAAVHHPSHDLYTTVLGHELAMPVIVSPAGYIRLAHRGGEVAAARAAGAAGIPAGVSTLSSYPIGAVAAASSGPVWYQVYFAGGRAGAEIAIDRAAEAGCTALIVTVDVAVAAGRERALRGGGTPTKVDLRNALLYAPEMILRPRWLVDFLRDGLRLDVPNVRATPTGPPLSAAEASKSMRRAAPTWADFDWIRRRWHGPLVIKGILRAEDARLAVDVGADAIVVSNHGGNALDGTPSALRVLPEIVGAVGDDIEVLVDGGVRRGADVAKAVALGARAVLIGRAYIWGLAAAGEPGVARVLEILRDGLERTLALLGCPSVSALDRSYIEVPASWARSSVG
ncbi:MAG TPA: alpha-hydroxy acid oxidase [Acidimicrobiales bacterium]|jgi:isopentenyl diphosphate isomerase/L-lactate dehydrogenase-like FMN-dependent dehydrogenase|nr:alpha-hydroxy acid oxidase [Acidimicrobiales bacterium]